MTRSVSASQYIQQVSQLRAEFARTQQELASLAAQNSQQVDELSGRTHTALTELTAAILPTLDAAALARAVELTGYLPLVQNDPLAAVTKSHQNLRRRSEEIEADRRYRDRMLLRAPRIGLLTREVAELEWFRAPLQDLITKYAHERLDHLLQNGYGTPAYKVPFWRMSYFSDWQAGDQICARFGDNKAFAELRADYLTARDTIAVYDTKLGKLREEVRLGESLEYEHDDVLRQIDNLPQTVLTNLREQLASYLRDIDLVSIGDRLALQPQIDGMAKRYLGLRKQTEYLRDSGQHLLQNSTAPVVQTIQSLDREILKYQRPKLANSYAQSNQLDRLRQLQQRNAKCQQQSQRYQQTSSVVYLFDGYHQGRLDDDFLWWDLMTHSYSERYHPPQRIYGNFIPEVAQFHASHPDYHYQSAAGSDLLADAEAEAAAASLGADDAQFSGTDLS